MIKLPPPFILILALPLGLTEATIRTIQDIRDNGWEELFKEVKVFCLKHNIAMPNMEEMVTTRGHSRGCGG
jgi:hypothetical protein